MGVALTIVSNSGVVEARNDRRSASSKLLILLEFLIRQYSYAARAEWREDALWSSRVQR